MERDLVNDAGLESKPRRISLVIEDDGKTKFGFRMEGDTERINKVNPAEYSAAEFWAVQLFAICQKELQTHGEIKKLNRDERRRGG